MLDFDKHLDAAEASISVKLNSMKKYNVTIQGRRTSVTLEPMVWAVLNSISKKQDCTVHDLCDYINDRKKPNANLSSAIRAFLISYLFIYYEKH